VLGALLAGFVADLAPALTNDLPSLAHDLRGSIGSQRAEVARATMATEWLVGVCAPAWLDLAGRIDLALDLRRVVAQRLGDDWGPALDAAAAALRQRWLGKPGTMDATALEAVHRAGARAMRDGALAGLYEDDPEMAACAEAAYQLSLFAAAFARILVPVASADLERSLAESAVAITRFCVPAGDLDHQGDIARQTAPRWLGARTLPFGDALGAAIVIDERVSLQRPGDRSSRTVL
jgi:hypothetical protein